jgi:transposase InsO family protein
VIQNHPNRAIAHLGRKLVRCLACHRSTFSGVGASDKPGAVQTKDPTPFIINPRHLIPGPHKNDRDRPGAQPGPCFTPVESPQSNGMAEAFVKTFKRNYIRVSQIPDAAAALAVIDNWMEDYNTVHPHSRLGYRSPQEYILSQSVACPV